MITLKEILIHLQYNLRFEAKSYLENKKELNFSQVEALFFDEINNHGPIALNREAFANAIKQSFEKILSEYLSYWREMKRFPDKFANLFYRLNKAEHQFLRSSQQILLGLKAIDSSDQIAASEQRRINSSTLVPLRRGSLKLFKQKRNSNSAATFSNSLLPASNLTTLYDSYDLKFIEFNGAWLLLKQLGNSQKEEVLSCLLQKPGLSEDELAEVINFIIEDGLFTGDNHFHAYANLFKSLLSNLTEQTFIDIINKIKQLMKGLDKEMMLQAVCDNAIENKVFLIRQLFLDQTCFDAENITHLIKQLSDKDSQLLLDENLERIANFYRDLEHGWIDVNNEYFYQLINILRNKNITEEILVAYIRKLLPYLTITALHKLAGIDTVFTRIIDEAMLSAYCENIADRFDAYVARVIGSGNDSRKEYTNLLDYLLDNGLLLNYFDRLKNELPVDFRLKVIKKWLVETNKRKALIAEELLSRLAPDYTLEFICYHKQLHDFFIKKKIIANEGVMSAIVLSSDIEVYKKLVYDFIEIFGGIEIGNKYFLKILKSFLAEEGLVLIIKNKALAAKLNGKSNAIRKIAIAKLNLLINDDELVQLLLDNIGLFNSILSLYSKDKKLVKKTLNHLKEKHKGDLVKLLINLDYKSDGLVKLFTDEIIQSQDTAYTKDLLHTIILNKAEAKWLIHLLDKQQFFKPEVLADRDFLLQLISAYRDDVEILLIAIKNLLGSYKDEDLQKVVKDMPDKIIKENLQTTQLRVAILLVLKQRSLLDKMPSWLAMEDWSTLASLTEENKLMAQTFFEKPFIDGLPELDLIDLICSHNIDREVKALLYKNLSAKEVCDFLAQMPYNQNTISELNNRLRLLRAELKINQESMHVQETSKQSSLLENKTYPENIDEHIQIYQKIIGRCQAQINSIEDELAETNQINFAKSSQNNTLVEDIIINAFPLQDFSLQTVNVNKPARCTASFSKLFNAPGAHPQSGHRRSLSNNVDLFITNMHEAQIWHCLHGLSTKIDKENNDVLIEKYSNIIQQLIIRLTGQQVRDYFLQSAEKIPLDFLAPMLIIRLFSKKEFVLAIEHKPYVYYALQNIDEDGLPFINIIINKMSIEDIFATADEIMKLPTFIFTIFLKKILNSPRAMEDKQHFLPHFSRFIQEKSIQTKTSNSDMEDKRLMQEISASLNKDDIIFMFKNNLTVPGTLEEVISRYQLNESDLYGILLYRILQEDMNINTVMQQPILNYVMQQFATDEQQLNTAIRHLLDTYRNDLTWLYPLQTLTFALHKAFSDQLYVQPSKAACLKR